MKTSITNIEFANKVISHLSYAYNYHLEMIETKDRENKLILEQCCKSFIKSSKELLGAMFALDLINKKDLWCLSDKINSSFSKDFISNIKRKFKECGIDVE